MRTPEPTRRRAARQRGGSPSAPTRALAGAASSTLGRMHRAERGGRGAAPREAETAFCACAPGVEPLLAAELGSLGLAARPLAGGVLASGEDAAAMACLGSRLADAVLLRLWEGGARELPGAR